MATEKNTSPESAQSESDEQLQNEVRDTLSGSVENRETETELQPAAEAGDVRNEVAVAQTGAAVEDSAEECGDEDAGNAVEDDGGECMPDETEEPAEKFVGKNKAELVDMLDRAIAENPIQTLRREVEALKVAFYKLHRADVEAARKAFVEIEGEEAEFVPSADASEITFKELLKEYRRRRDEYLVEQESLKEENYKTKLQIIEELKELIGSDEKLNHTFAKFRELQQRWKETGTVPQQYLKDLWETYNLHVENFYNFIKINKELRDLDLKKNCERKEALCAAAGALADEKSVVEAFHKLQKLHDEWRETGPVANELKEPLWERFKEASSRVNKRHQEYFESLKEEQMHNLDLKTAICEQVEALVEKVRSSRKEWNKASEKLLELQTQWKGIGFAPREDNNRIYERFRTACDRFFEMKREFYAEVKDEMERNLQLKNEICEAAEALRDSEEWKKATDELIALQAKWKEIGAVSRRHSDAVWKRFRSACDAFFARKAEHFASVDGEYEDNLVRKTALIAEMLAADIEKGGYEMIKEFQRRWSEIGFVPVKSKNAIQKQYKEAVDKMFGVLRGSERDRSITRFREKVSSLAASGDRRLRGERERLYNKVRKLEQDIALLENNIGFFSKSKNSERLIADVEDKIERAKRELSETIEKVRMIDESAEKQ